MGGRITDECQIWSLPPIDLGSYQRCYDNSRPRDEMSATTETEYAPWYVARSDDKKRDRLNLIAPLLGQIPYEELPHKRPSCPLARSPATIEKRITRLSTSRKCIDPHCARGWPRPPRYGDSCRAKSRSRKLRERSDDS